MDRPTATARIETDGVCQIEQCPECAECCLLPVTNGVICRRENKFVEGEENEAE